MTLKKYIILILIVFVTVSLIFYNLVNDRTEETYEGKINFRLVRFSEEMLMFLGSEDYDIVGKDILIQHEIEVITDWKDIILLNGTLEINGETYYIESKGQYRLYTAKNEEDFYTGNLDGQISSKDKSYPINVRYRKIEADVLYTIYIEDLNASMEVGGLDEEKLNPSKYKWVN